MRSIRELDARSDTAKGCLMSAGDAGSMSARVASSRSATNAAQCWSPSGLLLIARGCRMSAALLELRLARLRALHLYSATPYSTLHPKK